MRTINLMSFRHSAFYTPYLLTMGAGLLKKQGLDYHYQIAKNKDAVEEGVNNGTIDVSQYAVAASFASLKNSNQGDLIHFAQINQKDGFFIVARNTQKIFEWQDLKAKKMLVDHLFQPFATLNYVLNKQGVSLNDIEVINAGNEVQMIEAFIKGEGDYIHLQGPNAQQLTVTIGAQIQISVGEVLGDIAFSSLCCNKKQIKSTKLLAFCTAYKQALVMANELPAKQLAQLVHKFFPKTSLELLIETIRYYQQMGCWSKKLAISVESFNHLQTVFLFNKLIDKKFSYEQLVATV